jgi:hypothetical protein
VKATAKVAATARATTGVDRQAWHPQRALPPGAVMPEKLAAQAGPTWAISAQDSLKAQMASLGGSADRGGVAGNVGSAGGPDMGGGGVVCNMDDGGVAAGGVAGLDRDNGERVSSSLSSCSRSSSSSFRRRLGLQKKDPTLPLTVFLASKVI